MREYILTESEREALRRYLETGDKTPELRVLETRIKDNLMSGRLPEDYQFIERWVYAYCEGKVRRFVTYGSEPAQKVAKTLVTMIRKETITPSEIRQILNGVQAKTVLACSEPQLSTDRSGRFSELQQLLGKALK
jgi:hypothetical protein